VIVDGKLDWQIAVGAMTCFALTVVGPPGKLSFVIICMAICAGLELRHLEIQRAFACHGIVERHMALLARHLFVAASQWEFG